MDTNEIEALANESLKIASDAIHEATKLRAQRDALAAALRTADAWVAQYHGRKGHDAAAQSMSRVIRAALASLDGGKA